LEAARFVGFGTGFVVIVVAVVVAAFGAGLANSVFTFRGSVEDGVGVAGGSDRRSGQKSRVGYDSRVFIMVAANLLTLGDD
jgi:hypothetical protein